jgi:hypothetical protein
MDDFWEHQRKLRTKQIKQMLSFNKLIPSEDFTSIQYSSYLECGCSGELEMDIVTKDTYQLIMKNL